MLCRAVVVVIVVVVVVVVVVVIVVVAVVVVVVDVEGGNIAKNGFIVLTACWLAPTNDGRASVLEACSRRGAVLRSKFGQSFHLVVPGSNPGRSVKLSFLSSWTLEKINQ